MIKLNLYMNQILLNDFLLLKASSFFLLFFMFEFFYIFILFILNKWINQPLLETVEVWH